MTFDSLLLRRVAVNDIRATPYPYLIKCDTIAQADYDVLSREFPDVLSLPHRTNGVNRHSLDFRSAPAVEIFGRSAAWRAFRDNLFSKRFLDEFMVLFHDEVRALYPQMAARAPRLVAQPSYEWLRSWYRMTRSFRESVYIQATFNVSGDGYAIGPHYDNPKKLAAGLFYLRQPDDHESEGGELLVMRHRDAASDRVFKRLQDTVDDPDLEVVQRLPYDANTFCFMFNSPRSLHAATEYRGHGRYRRFIYFDVATFYRLF